MWHPCLHRSRGRGLGAEGRLQTGLYARLSGYYFFFYAVLGLMLPYFSLWLADRGQSAAQIGLILAAHGATRVILPPLWGQWADISGKRLQLIQWASLGSACGFALLPWGESFWPILGAVLLFSLFWNATMPQFEAYTLGTLSREGGDYSRVRLWGSVGFVFAVLGGGAGFESLGINAFPWVVTAVILLLAWVAFVLPAEPRPQSQGHDAPLAEVLRRPVVMALFAACLLHQFSFAPFYGFFSLYLEQHQWSKGAIGFFWAFGVICEVAVFVWTGALLRRFGLRWIFLAAMLSTVLRWASLEHVADSALGLLLVQALHLSSFGLYHACAVNFIHREFGAGLQGRGQALHVSLSFGLGGAMGSAVAGGLWEWAGPEVVFRMAAVAAALATVVAWRWVR